MSLFRLRALAVLSTLALLSAACASGDEDPTEEEGGSAGDSGAGGSSSQAQGGHAGTNAAGHATSGSSGASTAGHAGTHAGGSSGEGGSATTTGGHAGAAGVGAAGGAETGGAAGSTGTSGASGAGTAGSAGASAGNAGAAGAKAGAAGSSGVGGGTSNGGAGAAGAANGGTNAGGVAGTSSLGGAGASGAGAASGAGGASAGEAGASSVGGAAGSSAIGGAGGGSGEAGTTSNGGSAGDTSTGGNAGTTANGGSAGSVAAGGASAGIGGIGGASGAGGSGIACVTAVTCPTPPNECVTATCNGTCGTDFVGAGTKTPTQNAGDCQVLKCDGSGNVDPEIDDTDVPSSSNPCILESCVMGKPTPSNATPGTSCGGSLVCDSSQKCVGCVMASDCPGVDTDCAKRTCSMEMCGTLFTGMGTATTQQTPGDCHVNECDGAGHSVPQIDDNDTPAPAGDCTTGACNGGVSSTPPLAQNTECTDNGGTVCNTTGMCVACVASLCPGVDNECGTRVCTSTGCGMSYTASGFKVASQTSGDCHANECDGSGNVVPVIDNTDLPTGTTCAPGTCSGGMTGVGTALLATACSDNGGVACDGKGVCTQTFTVVRVGTGAAALTSSTTAAFLETYYPIAGSSPVSIVSLPTAASGSEQALTVSGTSTTEGSLSRSENGHYLAIAGYAIAPGGAVNAAATRAVGRIDAAGLVDSTTTLAAAAFGGASGSVRSATSSDGTKFWVSGTSSTAAGGGVWTVALGAVAGGTQITDLPNNMRFVNIFGGQLYGDTGAATYTSVVTIGVGEPTTTNQTCTVFPGMTTTNPEGFQLFDTNALVPGLDTLFVADSGTGVQRWTFDGVTWTKDTSFTVLTTGALGVTGWVTSTGVRLIATMNAGTIQVVDVPSSGTATATLLETAVTNTAYRGVALAPH